MIQDDPGFWSKIALWTFGISGAFAAIIWGDMLRRVHKVETNIDGKAEKTELYYQRDVEAKLFHEQTELRVKIDENFKALTNQMHDMHIDLLQKIEERKQRR